MSSLVNELPEMLGIRQGFIFAQRQLGPVKEVRKRSLVQHAVHDHPVIGNSEVKPPVLRPEAVEGLSIALNFSKTLIVEILQIILGHLELIQEFQLLQGPQLGNLGGTNFIEDNLKHSLIIIYHRTETHRKNLRPDTCFFEQ